MPGTITIEHYELGNIRKIVATCTADAAAATFPDTVLPKFEGRLLDLATNPGATAPTANYDVTVLDQHGRDVLESVGLNRHTTNTEKAPIVYSGTGLHPTVDESDTLTLNIDNNAVNSAITVIEIYYALGG